MTTVFVTHDQEEAFEMADQVVVMNQGRIEQIGKIRQLNPAGSVLKVRVSVEDFGIDLSVDVTHERARSLGLKLNDSVFVHPKSVRVFVPELDYVI